jgi:hypothetical protein
MTTLDTSLLIPVLTHNGTRIPARGTIAMHPTLGFGEVVTRSGSRLRIAITDPAEGAAERLAAVSAARTAGAEIEIAGLEARRDGLCPETGKGAHWACQDAFIGATALVNGMIESLIARCTEANEVLVNIDDAEAFGWEFDEFAMELPKSERKRGKAPAPRLPKKPVSTVGAVEDPAMEDWMVAEMNECFGEYWTPTAERKAALTGDAPDA